MPVYDEGPAIAAAIKAVRATAGGWAAEIIVSRAGPDAASRPSSAVPGVTFLNGPSGRARQMNLGAEKASGDVLVFLHADTVLPPDAFKAMERALQTGYYCGGAFRLKIDSRNPWLRFVAWTANIRNIFTRAPYGDQAIFIRKGFFRGLGGYEELPIMEDVELVTRIRRVGGRMAILREFVTTSPRRWKREGMLRTTLTHHVIRLLYLAGVSPEKLARYRAARGFSALRGLFGPAPQERRAADRPWMKRP